MAVKKDKKKIEELLTRGIENVYPSPDFLRKELMSGRKLKLYYGIDPTGSSLHLGHSVPLMKLRLFQDLGHQIILLIGDFTGMIGDPTDKSATRKRLTREQVLANAKNYKKQASMILDFKGPNKPEVMYNSKWLAKLSFEEIIELASNFTVPQILQRDMFKRRLKENKDIFLHEFLYPLMQGYDTVAMDVDGELGGNDQTFNMLAGRNLLRKLKNKEKFVLTTKLLVDPSGKKMGKTEGNMVMLSDTADQMFGKIMSWTDEMIVPAFEVLTSVPTKEINKLEKEMKKGANPRDIKARLAREIVTIFNSKKEADNAQAQFESTFKKHEAPDDMPEFKTKGQMKLIDILVESKLASSKSEARRLIDGKGVKVDGEVVEDQDAKVSAGSVIQKGKRFFVRLV